MEPPDLARVIADAAPLIDARVALTGRPREVYETYLTRPPIPGQTWEDAIFLRRGVLALGLLPDSAVRQLRPMWPGTPQAPAA